MMGTLHSLHVVTKYDDDHASIYVTRCFWLPPVPDLDDGSFVDLVPVERVDVLAARFAAQIIEGRRREAARLSS